jgi:hypothetical protein
MFMMTLECQNVQQELTFDGPGRDVAQVTGGGAVAHIIRPKPLILR